MSKSQKERNYSDVNFSPPRRYSMEQLSSYFLLQIIFETGSSQWSEHQMVICLWLISSQQLLSPGQVSNIFVDFEIWKKSFPELEAAFTYYLFWGVRSDLSFLKSIVFFLSSLHIIDINRLWLWLSFQREFCGCLPGKILISYDINCHCHVAIFECLQCAIGMCLSWIQFKGINMRLCKSNGSGRTGLTLEIQ
jgi:hypothetical protein